MVEYSVILKRHKGSTRPDVFIFSDEDREKAIAAMRNYVMKHGFTVQDHDGRFTIAGVHLIAKERIAGAPILSETAYLQIFNEHDERRKEELPDGKAPYALEETP